MIKKKCKFGLALALLQKETVPSIIESTIKNYQKLAWIGYRMEGLTPCMILRRAGCWDVANIIEGNFVGRPTAFNAITVSYLVNLKKANYHLVGLNIEDEDHEDIIRSLVEFQRWHRKSTPAQIEASLTLMSYFKSPSDVRSIVEVVSDSENAIYKKFEKSMKNNLTRARTIASIVSKSKFPHGRKQVDAFAQKYTGKPGLAEEKTAELLNVKTTHSWVEEKEAYGVLRRGVRLLGTILGKLLLIDICNFHV